MGWCISFKISRSLDFFSSSVLKINVKTLHFDERIDLLPLAKESVKHSMAIVALGCSRIALVAGRPDV